MAPPVAPPRHIHELGRSQAGVGERGHTDVPCPSSSAMALSGLFPGLLDAGARRWRGGSAFLGKEKED